MLAETEIKVKIFNYILNDTQVMWYFDVALRM